MISRYKIISAFAILAGLTTSCGENYNDTGVEYAPDMYHSVAYEPLKQITDIDAGSWRGRWGVEEDKGDFFNSNLNNPHGMNMRAPVPGTVSRRRYQTTYMGAGGSGDTTMAEVSDLMIYNIPKDSLEYAARTIKNPIPASEQVLTEGKILYTRYCQHCHGETGKGDGLVGKQYKGVPSYSSAALAGVSGGHIYHVITHGRGRMWPHGSQIDPAERWKIVHYVQTLQKQ